MQATIPRQTGSEIWPKDLRELVGDATLARLAQGAAQTIGWLGQAGGGPKSASRRDQAEMMGAVLLYSYAANILAAEEIEAETKRDATLGQLAEQTNYEPTALRRFRRQHREQLHQGLCWIMAQSWAIQQGQPVPDWCPIHCLPLNPTFSCCAEERLSQAVMWDSLVAD